MLSSYNDAEITTPAGKVACSKVLAYLGILGKGGYLRGAKPATVAYYTEISSQFIGSAAKAASPVMQAHLAMAGGGLHIAAAAAAPALDNNVAAAVKGVTTGNLKTMAAGEQPVELATDNVRATMTKTPVSKTGLMVLAPPPTDAAKAYGAPQPTISIVNSQLARCGFSGGFAQLSTLTYGSNPHPGSSAVESPLLQMSTMTTVTTPKKKRRLEQALRRLEEEELAMAVSGAARMPAFYVTMPFATPQPTFNYTAYMKGKSPANTTIPACKLYNGKAYTSCGHCNITSFMTMNVTYGCYDISKLCPKGAATSRRLDEANEAGVVEVDVGIDAEEWQELEAMEWIENEHEFNAKWLRRALRRGVTLGPDKKGDDGGIDDALLAGAANATSTETTDDEGADGGESHDDIFNTQNSVSINEFGALAEVRRSHQSRPTPSSLLTLSAVEAAERPPASVTHFPPVPRHPAAFFRASRTNSWPCCRSIPSPSPSPRPSRPSPLWAPSSSSPSLALCISYGRTRPNDKRR